MTPVLLTEYLTKMEQSLDLQYSWLSKESIDDYLSALSATITSLFLIPFLLDMMVLMEDWRTKSERQLALLNRNFFFMIINMLFLNLTGLITIKALFWEAEKMAIQTWP